MGKGGYHGGSTIVHLWPSQNDLAETYDPHRNKIFSCGVCGGQYQGITYWDHLESHGLKGCINCGEPYEHQGKSSYTCLKCGKVILLSLEKGPSEQLDRKNAKTKMAGNCKAVVKTKNNQPRLEKATPILNSPKRQNKEFSLTLGELLIEAFKKKQNKQGSE